MKLYELTGNIDAHNIEIKGITSDSRAVEDGFIFAAFEGVQSDGHDFIEAAIEKGAIAILSKRDDLKAPKDIPVIHVKNARRSYSEIAAALYGDQPERVYAVTGTSGKSSIVWFCRELCLMNGIKAGSIGTMGVFGDDYAEEGSLTSPEPVVLHKAIARLKSETQMTDLFLEASSHGIDQERIAGLDIHVAAFTNLSHEHLDYHETLEAYFNAKMRLFTVFLEQGGAAVINADIPEYETIKDLCYQSNRKILSYGLRGSDVTLISSKLLADGQDIVLSIGQGKYQQTFEVKIPLIGAFQVSNLLCALTMILAGHPELDREKLIASLSKIKSVPGRLEPIAFPKAKAQIFIDYAHKPGALEAVLNAVRPHTEGDVYVVFGCGGNRDAEKRALMGAIAQKLADHIIVTDDNPRNEDPATIRAAILDSAPKAIEIGDRRKDSAHALAHLKPGDSLIIAGKGHESGQLANGTTTPFDDRTVTREEIQKL